jgi:hypothetical protein
MKIAFRHCAWMRILAGMALLTAGLAASTGVRATSYLQAQGGIQALVGGPGGGYNQTVSPAASPNSAAGSDTVQATAGPYAIGQAPQFGSASASSSASFGELVESSSAQARGYTAYVYAGYGGISGYALDVIYVHGGGDISVTLHSELSGATSLGDPSTGNASVRTEVDLSPSGYTNNSQIIGLQDQAAVNTHFDSFLSGTIVAHEGDAFYVGASLKQTTSVQLLDGGLDGPALRTVTASTQAALNYWVTLSPGATLTSDSGFGYGAPLSAVPEPSTAALLLTGALAGALTLGRRRRRH